MKMQPKRIVFAPDSFKGTATASEVASALAAGWHQVRPDDELHCLPMADGGEGVLEIFEQARPDARRMPLTVCGPDGEPTQSFWLLLPESATGKSIGVVELASTSGITLLNELAPLTSHTLGFGQAIAAALEFGVHQLLLAIGSSASSDGGSGALRALGAKLLDADGRGVALGNSGLAHIATVDLSALAPLPPGRATVMVDVSNTLLGPAGAIATFGPQKGITAELAGQAEQNLRTFAKALTAVREAETTQPGAGAAGGTGFGLAAWGATLRAGAPVVDELIGFSRTARTADAVITGEGRFDDQSHQGKVAGYVSDQCRDMGVPLGLVAGAIDAPATGFDHALSLSTLAGSAAAARAEPQRWLQDAGRRLARAFTG